MSRAVLALGSNLGDRYAHLRAAVTGLRDVLVAVSGIYETPPWDPPGQAATPTGTDQPRREQPAYLNAVVVAVDDEAAPQHWLARAHELERAAGRVRDPDWRFGPRTLDVDVIAVWDRSGNPITLTDAELTLPHPRAHLRAFVLRPWLDVEPYARLPGHGWVDQLLRTEAVVGDLPGLHPRMDLPLE